MVRNKDGVDISTVYRLHRRYRHRPMRACVVYLRAGGRTADLHIPNRNGDNGEKTA